MTDNDKDQGPDDVTGERTSAFGADFTNEQDAAATAAATNSGLRSFTPTMAPMAAMRRAVARPMPCPAPVMSATRPSISPAKAWSVPISRLLARSGLSPRRSAPAPVAPRMAP